MYACMYVKLHGSFGYGQDSLVHLVKAKRMAKVKCIQAFKDHVDRILTTHKRHLGLDYMAKDFGRI